MTEQRQIIIPFLLVIIRKRVMAFMTKASSPLHSYCPSHTHKNNKTTKQQTGVSIKHAVNEGGGGGTEERQQGEKLNSITTIEFFSLSLMD